MIRLVVNSFAPINRIPPEVLSLIPDYWYKDVTGEDMIALTHVCRGWRTIFTSRPSLWSSLDCTNVDMTRTYIERSKAAPLELWLEDSPNNSYNKEAFFLMAPHISRLKYLNIRMEDLQEDIISHFFCHAPLLEELHIDITPTPSVLSGAFLDGDLPSLRRLTLDGVITHLPWKNLSNLVLFDLRHIPADRIAMTQLLDFFENTPLLHKIVLRASIPGSSDAPPERIVSLPHLKKFAITAQPAHTVLLNHLSIPHATLVVLEFDFSGDIFPIPDYLPRPSQKLCTLSRVTSINLLFSVIEKSLRLNGPDGGTYVFAHWVSPGNTPPYVMDRQILHSLDQSILSTTERLAICELKLPILQVNQSQEFQTLSSMNNLRALVLTKCYNLPFILALNPRKTPSNTVICPKLEELKLYIEGRDSIHATDMLDMAEGRALGGAKLSLIAIIGPGDVMSLEVFGLMKHVVSVWRTPGAPLVWHVLTGRESGDGWESE